MLTSRANAQLINQNALENVLVDIQFLKDQFMVVGLDKFIGIFDELVMVSIFFPYPIPHPCARAVLNRALYTPDRRHTGERPSRSVPGPATDEIRSCKTTKTTSTPGEVSKVRFDTSRPSFEGARGKEEERG